MPLVFSFFFLNQFLDEDDATTSGVNLEDAGKRVLFINQQQPQKYCNNHISTAKYR
jgi:phospholipid-transporting ATPase